MSSAVNLGARYWRLFYGVLTINLVASIACLVIALWYSFQPVGGKFLTPPESIYEFVLLIGLTLIMPLAYVVTIGVKSRAEALSSYEAKPTLFRSKAFGVFLVFINLALSLFAVWVFLAPGMAMLNSKTEQDALIAVSDVLKPLYPVYWLTTVVNGLGLAPIRIRDLLPW